MDRFQSMSVFVEVAENGSFTAAGRRLNLSPPSVTRAVSALEERLGARLLHRTTRQVRLTEAGQRYLSHCRRILQDLQEADRVATGTHGELNGNIAVSAPVLFGRMVVAPHLFAFLRQHPEVTVTTLFVDRVVDLINEGIDVAVRIAELPDSTLSAVRVGAVRRVFCASPDYIRRRGRPATPDALDGHDTIAFSTDLHPQEWTFWADGTRTRFKPQAGLRVNLAETAIAAAMNGHGITRVHSYQVAPHLEAGTLELVLDDYAPPSLPVHVVHKEPGHTSARVRAVVDDLVTRLRREDCLRQERPH